MLKCLAADYELPSVFSLSPSFLAAHGIRGVILDLDNTLEGHHAKTPSEEVRQLAAAWRAADITAVLFSNGGKARAASYAAALDVPCVCGCKPFAAGYKKTRAFLPFAPHQIAAVGDQLFTDVLGGNLQGMQTVLVRPLTDEKEPPFVRFKRLLEKAVGRK